MAITNTTPATARTVKRAKKNIIVKKNTKAAQLEKIRTTRAKKEKKAATRKKQDEALKLRMTGATYQDIASALGYKNPSSAKWSVDQAIWRTEREAAKEVVALDLARLDEYQMRCTHALRANGDLHQIDRLLRIMEFRYRLLGVNEETVRALQSEHGIHVTSTKNNVQIIMASPETEKEFVEKMMKAVGVDPDSEVAKQYLDMHKQGHDLPMLEGSVNSERDKGISQAAGMIDEDDIVDAEIVEALDGVESEE